MDGDEEGDGEMIDDLTGKRFGRLTVIGYAGLDHRSNAMWDCQCDCGRTTRVRGSTLKEGRVKSCGCLGRETRSGNISGYHEGRRVYFEVDGEMLTVKELAERTGVPYSSITARRSEGKDVVEHLRKKGLLP